MHDRGVQATLFEMILAANFLDIKPMLDLTCKTGTLRSEPKTATPRPRAAPTAACCSPLFDHNNIVPVMLLGMGL